MRAASEAERSWSPSTATTTTGLRKAKKMVETGAEDISSASEASADYAATEKPLKREQTV